MTDMVRIAALLKAKSLPAIGSIVLNPSTPGAYFVPLRLTRRADGRKSPSGLALAEARSNLLAIGFAVDFILIDEDTRDIEESLRASLLSSFPDDVRNSFFSSGDGHPQAWIEFKKPRNPETTRRLDEHLRKFADIFHLPSLSMTPMGEANTPTRIEILTLVRRLSPVPALTLMSALVDRGHDVPSLNWVNRRLDALRKGNAIIRRQDGSYVLTKETLKHLGTQKGRRSPDVQRFLALASRGS